MPTTVHVSTKRKKPSAQWLWLWLIFGSVGVSSGFAPIGGGTPDSIVGGPQAHSGDGNSDGGLQPFEEENRRIDASSMMSRSQVLAAALTLASSSSSLLLFPTISHARNLPSNTGADTSNTGTVETLIPIVRMRQALDGLQQQLSKGGDLSATNFPSTAIVPRDETAFKRLLDAYSDPVSYKQKFVDQNAFLVYYTKGFDGPGRPNIEADLPVKQTQQFGARNDAWVAWDDFLVEWEFAMKEKDASGSMDDLLPPLRRTLQALDAYLSLAPSEDLQQAKRQVQ